MIEMKNINSYKRIEREPFYVNEYPTKYAHSNEINMNI